MYCTVLTVMPLPLIAAAMRFENPAPGSKKPSPFVELPVTTTNTLLLPAATENQITSKNADRLKCKILCEGANGPTTASADKILMDKGVFVIPDILCNAGGVIVSYFEWVQDIQQFLWSEEQVNLKLQELMLRAFHQVRFLARERKFTMRSAALSLGVQKVAKEKLRRGLFP